MSHRNTSPSRLVRAASVLAALTSVCTGCAVVSVASTAVGIAASGVGLAVDAGVGAARITGKAIGATVDAVTPGSGQ
jgi:hypothetical protein